MLAGFPWLAMRPSSPMVARSFARPACPLPESALSFPAAAASPTEEPSNLKAYASSVAPFAPLWLIPSSWVVLPFGAWASGKDTSGAAETPSRQDSTDLSPRSASTWSMTSSSRGSWSSSRWRDGSTFAESSLSWWMKPSRHFMVTAFWCWTRGQGSRRSFSTESSSGSSDRMAFASGWSAVTAWCSLLTSQADSHAVHARVKTTHIFRGRSGSSLALIRRILATSGL
mmetsp:Transcript_17210/g.51543  ORF Transcript_17210/g.51543 Transcript_17210/m.51543 type:complete len:228 (-) Transcript_17210:196-879(-)